MPDVSVILRIACGEKYLSQCLDSLLSQSLRDIEVVCIHDSPAPGTTDLLCGYQQADARLHILEGSAASPSSALEAAMGEYVLFADSRNWYELNALSQAYSAARCAAADVVLMEGRRFNQPSKKFVGSVDFIDWNIVGDREAFSRAEIPDEIMQVAYLCPSLQLCRREFAQRLNVLPGCTPDGNDMIFCALSLAMAAVVAPIRGSNVICRINGEMRDDLGVEENPLALLNSLALVGSELKSAGLFDRMQNAFVGLCLSQIKLFLTTTKDDQARCSVLDRLDAHLMALDDLASGKALGLPEWSRELARFVLAAVSQRQRMRVATCPLPARCIAGRQTKSLDEPLVSVVMPVYNAMPYLAGALESICEQTMGDFELICVNDGSEDGSLEELLQWAEKDDRIIVYDQPNQGQSRARNVALDIAKGKYLYCMDADDLLEERAFEVLTDRMASGDLDLLFFDGASFYEDEELASENPWFSHGYIREHIYESCGSGAALIAKFYRNGEYLQSPCLYMVKRSVVESGGIRFIPGILHEDNAFTFAVGLHAKRTAHIAKQLFNRRVRRASTMTSSTSFAKSYGFFACAEEMAQECARIGGCVSTKDRGSLKAIVAQALANARGAYRLLSEEYRGCEFGLEEDCAAFIAEVRDIALRELQLENEVNCVASEVDRIRSSRCYRLAERFALFGSNGNRGSL